MNLQHKKLLMLDMNSTFMFGEDRFSKDEDYSKYYKSIGGELDDNFINQTINLAYDYLDIRYPDEKYRESFPSLEDAIKSVVDIQDENEIEKIIDTFAFYERGYIPKEYATCIKNLSKYFNLVAVIDIWAPSTTWIETFKEVGIYELFDTLSFSSDINIVKPSAIPFENILNKLCINPDEALIIGDSIRRDLGSAKLAEIECVIVGTNKTTEALACFESLLEFEKALSIH